MRKEEALGLTWDRVKYEGDIPHIKLEPEHTKNKKERKIPLIPNLVEMLKRRFKVRNIHDDRVFPVKYVNPTWNRAVINVFGERLYRLHDCRASFVTHMARFGVSGEYRRKITGHVSKDVHEDYFKPTIEDLHRQVMKVYHGMFEEETRIASVV